ncbi:MULTISPECIES: NADP-dependent oxidoreductase [Actinomadura]|uniref:NADPH:quinone reductase n=1 Tax=Actinomadura madurae TaxID=1993 RepID=A0A1I5D0J6_9ACTN|nr:NADP-dependent oxidoreductase [Actinomadura madurae]SFN92734.1 NADPH:quinone reductase [Actinomadura madurae]SPT50508.1 Zinc-type alcohol dehydrogenase-like protein SA1988 [Actinomadura madurae]
MRAIAVSEYGATPAPMNLPRPEPGPGEIVVKMIAAGLNPLDWKIAEGMLKDSVDAPFPLILGQDGAGVVDAVGEGVTRLRHGEQVYGSFLGVERGLGSYAEYALARDEGPVARIPEGMIYTQAAAVPTAGMTALAMIEEAGVEEAGAGLTVLVVGATGGVGQCVVQLASRAGARVIATARADMAGTMRRLGADETVDHAQGDLNRQVLEVHSDGIDVVLDMVSDTRSTEHIAQLLRPGGTYITTTWSVHPDSMESQGLRGVNFEYEPSAELLDRLSALIDAGELRVRVERELPLEKAADALADNRAGGARGKTVLRV